MRLDDLRYQSETDDITFSYKNKEYVICLINDKYYCGEAGNDDDDNSFNSFKDMSDNWIIEEEKLEDIVGNIKVI
ncbi:MAG: hypothetical protein ACRC3Y_11955 [Romboutsia sp.]|uniref:hypothetical protein n=1 Tax=Romboutsia sp. TaxID=1965302 RepID=UPI003F2A0192